MVFAAVGATAGLAAGAVGGVPAGGGVAKQLVDHRAHRIAGIIALGRIEQRRRRPERRIKLCGSGSMIGSFHGPCTTNGRSNSSALEFDISVATPFRSRSRVGTEAWPATASFTEGPIDMHVIDRYQAVLGP